MRPARASGFTIIELMVVVAIIGLLAAIAVPKYLQTLQRAKENRLRHDLRVMRDLIQQFKVDKKKYPETLDALVSEGYLRSIPKDAITGADTVCAEAATGCAWVEVHKVPEDPDDINADAGVEDVLAGIPGVDSEGVPYADY